MPGRAPTCKAEANTVRKQTGGNPALILEDYL